MKQCQVCHHPSPHDAATCHNCGEASFHGHEAAAVEPDPPPPVESVFESVLPVQGEVTADEAPSSDPVPASDPAPEASASESIAPPGKKGRKGKSAS